MTKKKVFKAGDIVELVDNFTESAGAGLIAKIGALAEVISVSEQYLRIKWLDRNSNGQCAGGYSSFRFKKLEGFSKPINDIDKEAIHEWFELTYANYLAIPRSVLQSMPGHWQVKFVELMDELDKATEMAWRRDGCYVQFRDRKGRYMYDNMNDYRHKNYTMEDIKKLYKDHQERFSKSLWEKTNEKA